MVQYRDAHGRGDDSGEGSRINTRWHNAGEDIMDRPRAQSWCPHFTATCSSPPTHPILPTPPLPTVLIADTAAEDGVLGGDDPSASAAGSGVGVGAVSVGEALAADGAAGGLGLEAVALAEGEVVGGDAAEGAGGVGFAGAAVGGAGEGAVALGVAGGEGGEGDAGVIVGALAGGDGLVSFGGVAADLGGGGVGRVDGAVLEAEARVAFDDAGGAGEGEEGEGEGEQVAWGHGSWTSRPMAAPPLVGATRSSNQGGSW